ncbi:hypothetical protein BHE74_00054697 [Ensete ventricosum]|nr:hypothetical protein BHE74_00054697 [Ensete ventricosum]
MYWSAKLPVRGPLATGRYHQNRLSIVNFGYWRSISTVGGRLREKSTIDSRLRKKKGRRRRGEEEYLAPSSLAHCRRLRDAREPSPPAGCLRAIFLLCREKEVTLPLF